MTNKRIQISDNVGGNKELRVSIPGFDVDTSTSVEEIAISSEWDQTALIHKKAVLSGYGTVTFDALPFIPFAFFYRISGNKLRKDEVRVASNGGIPGGVIPLYAMEVSNSSIIIYEPKTKVDVLGIVLPPYTYLGGGLTSPQFLVVVTKVKAFDLR
ncbi:MAG: hypothetical protein C0605_07935 [Hyphomicrobiales bacterium]|nr:MAG: hypothetical protein C0605_07935 [Hyphomicrobiales bacterium]